MLDTILKDLSWFQTIFSVLFFFLGLLLSVAITTLVERKVLSSIQRRRGPNVVGIFGFLQPIADAVKLFIKQTIIPKDADAFLFILAPLITLFCSFKILSVFFFESYDVPSFSMFGALYLAIFLSLGAYGIIFAGWSSNSKYAFLGGLRSTAQMISYEICLSFILLIIVMFAQSLDLKDIVYIQGNSWFLWMLLPLWFLFIISALAETNRAPFDLPEAEAELVAGYNVEYSAVGFVLFFLAEYANIISMSIISTIFFLGGWLPLFGLYLIPGFLWFSIKIIFNILVFIWVRGTFPRYRYDQLMKLGWKVLLPVTLILLLLFILLFYHIDYYASYYF